MLIHTGGHTRTHTQVQRFLWLPVIQHVNNCCIIVYIKYQRIFLIIIQTIFIYQIKSRHNFSNYWWKMFFPSRSIYLITQLTIKFHFEFSLLVWRYNWKLSKRSNLQEFAQITWSLVNILKNVCQLSQFTDLKANQKTTKVFFFGCFSGKCKKKKELKSAFHTGVTKHFTRTTGGFFVKWKGVQIKRGYKKKCWN